MINPDRSAGISADRSRQLADEEVRLHELGRLLLEVEDQASETGPESECRTAAGPADADGTMRAALEAVLGSWRDGTRRDVMGQIKAAMARMGQKHAAGTYWLSLADRGDVFSALVYQAQAERLDAKIGVDEPGIVPMVLRTNTAYATGNTRDDPFYERFFASTRSEQAAPVTYETEMRGVPPQAVVNQESRASAQYNGVGVEMLRQEAQSLLAPLLSEYDGLLAKGFPCVWNPRRHGWGIRGYLGTLLQQLKEQLPLNPLANNLHITIWYVDLEDRRLSTVADSGFSDNVHHGKSLPIDDREVLGALAHAADWRCETWSPGTDGRHVNQKFQVEMGTLRSRLIVLPELATREGRGRFRTIIQIDAFTRESVAILPDDPGLEEFGRRIHEQIAGYLKLYPRFAAYEIRRVLHESRTFSEQWHKVAEAMGIVLRSPALTIYARPWQNRKDLHIIAATAPLKRVANLGLITLNPDEGPLQTLLPSSHRIGDKKVPSFAGALAGLPDRTLRYNSTSESTNRILDEGFPRSPSPDHSEDVTPWTIDDPSNEKKFLGYSLPNRLYPGENAVAVALAVRPVDRAPFKAWDEAALIAMLDAAAPMISTWRDWSAVQIQGINAIIEKCGTQAEGRVAPVAWDFDESTRLAAKREVWKTMVLERLANRYDIRQRMRDPLPRCVSLESLTREIAARAYERAYAEFGEYSKIRRVTVLAESRDGDSSVVHPIACHHAFPQQPTPEPGSSEDPRVLPIADLGGNWGRFFDEGRPREFRGPGNSGLVIPFLAWVGGHAVRGALSLELVGECDPRGLRDDFMLLARRMAAGWTTSGSDLRRGQFTPKMSTDSFVRNLRTHLGADRLELRLEQPDNPGFREISPQKAAQCPIDEGPWLMPGVTSERHDRPRDVIIDPDCALWEIRETSRDGEVSLRIPLRFGTEEAGSLIARWSGPAWEDFLDDPKTTRAGWIRESLAAWFHWSWSWSEELEGSVIVAEAKDQGEVWATQIAFLDLRAAGHPKERAYLEASPETRKLIGGPSLIEAA